MTWLLRILSRFIAPVIPDDPEHPTFQVYGPPIHDEILADLLKAWPKIGLFDPPAIENWFQAVGYWLAQVPKEDAYQNWALRFACAIQAKHPGIPLNLCVHLIEARVLQHMKGAHV